MRDEAEILEHDTDPPPQLRQPVTGHRDEVLTE